VIFKKLKELKVNEIQLQAKKRLEEINTQEENSNESVNEILDKVTEMIEKKGYFSNLRKKGNITSVRP
jgi:ABC-type uncharacterized transport system substrate-binding protein